jgi:hypothetical protein
MEALQAEARRDPGTPSLVLYEHGWDWLTGQVFPRLAVWPDGAIVFRDATGAREGRLDPAEARRLVDETAARIRGAPAYASVSAETDQPEVELVIRDGDAWRRAAVYGLWPDGPLAPVELDDDLNLVEHPEHTPTEPAGFLAAYQDLRRVTAAPSRAFRPRDVEIMYKRQPAPSSLPLAWPADLPAPSTTAPAPARDDYRSWPLPLRYLDAARALDERDVVLDGHAWRILVLERFRGESVIDRLRVCFAARR